MTQVADVMTRGVRALSPKDTVVMAAQAMQELDVGAIPVCNQERLVGIVTDRDLVVRGVAHKRLDGDTPIDDVMTRTPLWCFEDQPVDDVLAYMRKAQVRRVPVIDRENRLVGMVSLGDLAVKGDEEQAGSALRSISEPARPDRSHQSQASGAAGGGASDGRTR
jgi:CBS domain-containing protein